MVRHDRIASRVEVTNDAIVAAVRACEPTSALDVGCGEGWLTRVMLDDGVDAWGLDACPELVDAARRAGADRYRVVAFDGLVDGSPHRPVDLMVANFALNTEASVPQACGAASTLLRAGGRLLVQAAHPTQVLGASVSGWRAGSWDGFGDGFVDAAPWYYRTVADWESEVRAAGLQLRECREPCGADGRPRSLLLVIER